MKNLTRIITIIAFSLIITQCKNKSEKIDPAFTGYIQAFTSGEISNGSNITIKLVDEQTDVVIGEPVEGLISFSPKIKGSGSWKDNRTFEFYPDSPLPSNKLFEAKFKLGKIIKVPSSLKTLKFEFRTIKQSLIVDFNELRAYEITDLTRQQLFGSLQTADFADENKIENIISATQNGKKLNITWEHNGNKYHTFIVNDIARTKDKGEIIVEWDGKYIESINVGDKVIQIPSLDDFSVFSVKKTKQPEQCITVFFSDPIDQKQELRGMIRLSNNADIRIVKNENSIKIYPINRLTSSTKLIIEEGVKNIMGFPMKKKFSKKITFSNIKPDIELIGNGVIIPNNNGILFPFRAVNISGVNVKIIKIFEDNVAQFLQANQYDGKRELKRVGRIVYKKAITLKSDKQIDYGSWNIFSLDLSKLIEVEPGAIYRVHLSFDKSQSLYPCNEEGSEKTEDLDFNQDDDDEMASYDEPYDSYYYYDDDDYYDDDYYWDEKGNPCKDSYYMRNNHSVARNVLASDIGIIAKGNSNNEITVAVTNLLTTEALNSVEVNIYNYQNQLINTGKTDANGMVTIPLKSKPFLLIAKYNNQRGYLRLDDGSSISLSMFDVSGNHTKKGLKGFIYTERGVWRPGDSIYVDFILEDKTLSLPKNHPVIFELYTPENQLFLKNVKTISLNGFYDFRTKTEKESPTGNWLVKIKVGGAIFTKYLKIETVKPNRLKIKLDFGEKVIKRNSNLNGKLEVKWLHGAIAKNIKADIEASLTQIKTSFKGFDGYHFDDNSKSFSSESKFIFDGQVNEKGEATLTPKFTVGRNAPGMLKAKFKTRAFESGGDFSTDITNLKYSPYKSYVGVKIPKGKGWNGALFSDESNLIPIATVDENGNKVNRNKIKIEIFEISWRWWWEHSDNDDLGNFVSNNSSDLIFTDYTNTVNGKVTYELNMNKETWGRKYIRITDPVSGHSCGQLFYTDYKGWWDNSDTDIPGGAEMLTFSTNKNKYNVGEEVQVEIPSSKKGKALVSIESGSKVVDAFWIKADGKENKFSFTATAEMTPNVFIHISYIQPHNQTTNDLPIRLFGVQPIYVEDAKTHIQPVITMPDVLEPEKKVTIKVSEKNNNKMTYTIAVVDEGLLDLTRFKTPDAWSTFYAREALGIKTWDMYKYVMGAFSGEMAGILAIGGGDRIDNQGGQKANRFTPVVQFFGPFELKRGTNSHTFTMPNYVGSVRTMVVAGNNGAYGSSEKTTPVKKPLMAIATLPRVMGPTETVKLPVTIFAMDDNIKKVDIKITTNSLFSVIGSSQKQLTYTEVGEKTVEFDLKVAKKIGIASVDIVATSGIKKASYHIELDVRLPNPRITKIIDGIIEPNKSWESEYTAPGMTGTNNAIIEVSTIPPLNLDNRLKYLIRYPHGCIEQTTSSVFPQLFLSSILDLDNAQKQDIEDNIKAAILRIKKFQLNNGGLTYWPGESGDANDWGTNYAGHFMLEAKKLGYALPSGFLKSWIIFQKSRANDWSINSNSSRYHYYNSTQMIQAYRLYTLALAGKPAIGAMNRMREIPNLSTPAKWRLATAYLLAGREKVAKTMITNLTTSVKPYTELSYSYGSDLRDEAMILESLVLLKNKTLAKKLTYEISAKMSSQKWYSTQTTAYTLLAIGKFIGDNSDSNEDINFKLKVNNDKAKNKNTDAAISQNKIDVNKIPKGRISIKNNNSKMLFVKVQMDGIPLIGDPTSTNNDLNLRIDYTDLDGNKIDVTRLSQGTDFIANVHIKHPGIRSNYKEMALTQIFPSGWEIRNLRMEGGSSSYITDEPRYQDIRDDRIYSYFDIKRNQSRDFKVLLNASYVGKFYLPTIYCEAMYNHEINAQKAGEWIEVVKE